MSIAVITALWKTCLYQGNTLNVLLAMGDWAADDGGDIYPGIDLLRAKARCSTRSAQDALRDLEDDGVIEQIANSRGGRGKVTEYKINLERVQELQGLHEAENPDCEHCAAKRKSEERRAQFRAKRVQSSTVKGAEKAQKGADHAAPIDNNRQQPSNNRHSDAPVGASENVASLGQGEAERWPEFRSAIADTWPNGFPADDEAKARRGFEKLTRLAGADILIRCARLHGAELKRRRDARGGAPGAFFVKLPSNWLRDGGWEGYAALAEPSANLPKVERLLQDADRKRLLRSGLNEAQIDAWFAQVTFEVVGGVVHVTAPTLFARNWIATHFEQRIISGWKPDFGPVSVTIVLRKEAA